MNRDLDVGTKGTGPLGVFRKRLQVFMLEQRWTIKQMASYLEVHPTTLRNWLDQKREPQTANAIKVATRLGLSLDDLVRERGE